MPIGILQYTSHTKSLYCKICKSAVQQYRVPLPVPDRFMHHSAVVVVEIWNNLYHGLAAQWLGCCIQWQYNSQPVLPKSPSFGLANVDVHRRGMLAIGLVQTTRRLQWIDTWCQVRLFLLSWSTKKRQQRDALAQLLAWKQYLAIVNDQPPCDAVLFGA